MPKKVEGLGMLLFKFLFISFFAVTAINAQQINFQGLYKSNANPTHIDLKVLLLTSPEEDDPIWEDNYKNVPLVNNIYNIVLGSDKPLNDLDFSKDLWIAVEINGVESAPQYLSSVPKSIVSREVSGKILSGTIIENGVAVQSINGKKDNVVLVEGEGIQIDNNGEQIKVSLAGDLASNQGPQGEKGEPGKGLEIEGECNETYRTANSTTQVDWYTCYDPNTKELFILNASNSWVNLGKVTGVKGDQGEQGIMGPQGETGSTITDAVFNGGDIEFTLSNGDKVSLADAINSLTGPQGPKGDSGEKGNDGNQGVQGQEGKSAYQIWLDAGNSGSESDFLNALIGAKGDQGEKGAQGEQGPAGIDGTTLEIVTGVTDSTGKSTLIDYPNGFNFSNSVALSINIKSETCGDPWKTAGGEEDVKVRLTFEGIKVYFPEAVMCVTYNKQPFRVVLIKTDNW